MSACSNPDYCGTGDEGTLCDNCRRTAEGMGFKPTVTITHPPPPTQMEADQPGNALSLDAQFRNLSAVASTLGQSTDTLSAAIKDGEAKLSRLGLGLICWMTIDKRPNQHSLHLGYGQINKQWCLMARLGPDTWPLSSAPRWVRIKAVNHFPELLDHLTKAALAMIERTEKATTAVREFLAAIQTPDL